MSQLGKALLVLAFIAYPVLLHLYLRGEGGSDADLLLAILPLLTLLGWFAWRATPPRWRLLVPLAFLLLAYWMTAGHERFGAIALSGSAHAALNLFLMGFFGRTLLPGREALITQITRRVNGGVQPDIARYTRHVTLAWTVYFGAQVMLSLLLYLFAPLMVWLTFINLMGWPLLVVMFGLEYLWRITRYPHHPRTSIRKAFEVYARDFAATRKQHP